MKYANTVQRLNECDKITAEFESEIFARNCNYSLVGIEKDRSGYWAQVFSDTDEGCKDYDDRFSAVDIVRCPNCNEVQACWGQYGDPATENTICTQCNNEFQVEPF